MPLLELAQQPEQTFEFRSEYQDSVVFDAQLESEELLTLSVYYDEKGNRTSADLRIENGDPEPITLEQARGLMPPRALQQQREAATIQFNDPPGEGPGSGDEASERTGNARRLMASGQRQAMEMVIFPVDQQIRPEGVRGGYVSVESDREKSENYFRLEEIRHEIVTGAANYDRSDPDVSRSAANYYAGKADLYNEIRASVIRENPSLEESLPWEINRAAIITPEIVEERDRAHEQPAQSLAIG